MSITVMDWFAGCGGSDLGMCVIPGVTISHVANHWLRAIETHARNFPETDHYHGDIRNAPVDTWPVCDIFWASPECPQWSSARGKRRDFDWSAVTLPGMEPVRDEEAERSRALMDEVPLYLAGVQRRGKLVLAGVVENVVEVRAWKDWDRWLGDLHKLGYATRVIAFNSMHANGTRSARAPQSRDRLYVAYWHKSLGRIPDWDKWLRPTAWCTSCDQTVNAVQSWKRRGADMGRYGRQYTIRCPGTSCRGAVVEPSALPAAAAIDWTLPAKRIGDRDKPLAAATLGRVQIGMDRYWAPLTRGWDGAALSPLLVPVEGRDGKTARIAADPLRTQTARNETGLALPGPSFMVEMRGGSSSARPITEPTAAVCASGNHLGLAQMDSLLVPYYGTGVARPTTEPAGTMSTRDRFALAAPALDIDDVRFRMLEPHEIGRAMAFATDYVVTGNKREQVRQYGNAVTPPVAELIVSALVEAITGADLERLVLAA